MSTTDFEDDRDPTGSLRKCYEIIPPDEADEIWSRCPLPDPKDWRSGTDEDDDPDIYIA